MSDVIGRGVIEMSADSTKLTAGINEAKKSIKSLGKDVSGSMEEATGKASRSIDAYVKRLETVAATNGKSARETELYKLSLRGASQAQIAAADSALRLNESHEQGIAIGQKLRAGLIAVAAAAGAAAVASVTHSIALLDSLDELSEKAGISVEALSGLRYAGEATGTTFDSLKGGLGKLAKTMAEAAGGNKQAIATFEALGVEVKNTDGTLRSSEGVLGDLATRFAGYEDGAAKAALAQQVFGKSGVDMIPLLNQGAAGISNLTLEATKLGAIYSGTIAKNAAEFNDNLTKIKIASEAAAISISGPLIESLARLSAEFLEAKKNGGLLQAGMATYGTWVKEFWSGKDNAGKSTEQIQKYVNSLGNTPAGGGRGFKNPQVAAPVVQDPEKKGPKEPKAPKDNSAEQEAKARLASDLEAIKNARAAITNTIANSEKVMEAQRAAALIDEGSYYAQKLAFLQQQEAGEVRALEAQKARLQQEKGTGKDAIDNAKQIATVNAQIAKVQADAATGAQVLGIQQDAAFKRIKDSITEARQAAQSYLDTIEKANARELNAMGKGQLARARGDSRNATDDRYEGQRQDLAGELRRNDITRAQYDDQLRIINEFHAKALAADGNYWTEKLKKQADWSVGASEALSNYYDESQNRAKQVEQVVTNAFQGMEDALVDFATTGKLDFKSLTDSIIKDLARIAIKQSITGPLSQALGGLFGGGSTISQSNQNTFDGFMQGLSRQKFAKGGVLSSPGLSTYSGQVVSKPTIFPFARGAGLMGEAGPEAILPLRRGADGKLGVAAGGDSGGSVTINNYSSAQVETKRTPDGKGGMNLEVLIREVGEHVENRIADNIGSGAGPVSRSMEGRYGLRTAVG